MSKEVIFEVKSRPFTYTEAFGAYVYQETPAPFTLTVGETYVVVWEGSEHTLTAFAADDFAPGTVCIGNPSFVGGEVDPDNLPFIVGYISATDYAGFITMSADESHTIGIYKVVEEAVYYSVSSLSLKSMANAIRAKNGTTDPISFPDGMVEAIGNISGGGTGGSSEYTDAIHTVTFKNGDDILYIRAVVDGDDCADVVARDLIETPTKESTEQYDYTHSGWSLTNGGSASSTALSAVTADRTVYAAYTSAVRYYTVTYYDSDGVTVLHTERVAYGTKPSYAPTKDDYIFAGWEPELTGVTGDTSYTAVWDAGLDFATLSFAEIDTALKAGKAHYFKLGATKSFKGSANHTITAVIVGINHDDLADGSGKAGLTLMMLEPSYSCIWDGTGTSALKAHTWLECNAYLDNGAYSLNKVGKFNAEFAALLKTVTKSYYNASGGYSTADVQFFLPAINEIANNNVRAGEGSVYEYFADGYANKLTYRGANGIWTRTKDSYASGTVYRAKNDGTYNTVSQGIGSNSPYSIHFCCI